jgi:preprotein translocase subunit SecD
MVDGVRQALRPGAIFYQTLEAHPEQNRILLKLRDATRLDAAVAAIRPLIAAEGQAGTPEFDLASTPDGTIVLTLSQVAMGARARGAVQQSIEIVRRRIDETGVVDPQITQQGEGSGMASVHRSFQLPVPRLPVPLQRSPC